MELEFDFEKRYRLVREVVETIVLTVLMFLVIRMAVQNFFVDGMSMEPNLHNTETILVDRWSYMLRAPSRGDVIVFIAPPVPSQDYVKRVIGLPGDVITVQGTKVYVNGKQISEPFLDPRRQGNQFPSFTNRVVPPNAYFVLGDNRGGSSDSRDWGCVPRPNIIGQAALVYWPLGEDNDGLLPNVSSAYSDIPSPSANLVAKDICPLKATVNASSVRVGNSQLDLSTFSVLAMPGLFVMYTQRARRRMRK